MKKGEVLELVKKFYQEVLAKKPSYEKMKEEAKIMGVSLRPVMGDLFNFATEKKERLVEIVWTIGKLDEFMSKKVKNLPKKEIELFLELFNELYINKLAREMSFSEKEKFSIELEIMKRMPLRKKLN